MRVTLANGATVDCDFLDDGATGEVYKTPDGQYAIKLFKQTRPELRRTLEAVISHRAEVTADPVAARLYCWPDQLVTGSRPGVAESRLGVRMPIIPSGFIKYGWFRPSPSLYQALPRPHRSWRTRLVLALRPSRAVARLHRCGLAHGDLSENNVWLRPNTGDVLLIDIDGIIIPGLVKPLVVGTRDYIAPEVIVSRGGPSRETDCHALAVMLHELLLFRHPLRGPLVRSPDSAIDERLTLGPAAIYIDHPTDHSNRPGRGFYPAATAGRLFAELCRRAFVEGVADPAARPAASEWELALRNLLDRTIPCGHNDCDGQWFPWLGTGLACPWCNRPAQFAAGLPAFRVWQQNLGGEWRQDPDRAVAVPAGFSLHRRSLDPTIAFENARDSPIARLELRGRHWNLVDLEVAALELADDMGKPFQPMQGATTPLRQGNVLRDPDSPWRLGVEMLAPAANQPNPKPPSPSQPIMVPLPAQPRNVAGITWRGW